MTTWAVPGAPAEGPPRRSDPPVGGRDIIEPDRPAVPQVPVPLRPMTAIDVLDGALATLKAAPRAVIGVTAALVVPVQVLGAWLQRDSIDEQGFTGALQAATTDPSDVSIGSPGATLVVVALSSLLLVFVAAGIARLVVAWYSGTTLTAREAIAAVGRRAPALIGGWVVVHLIEGVGVLLLFVPGVLAMAACLVTAPVIAVEGLGPIAAVRRSWRLTNRRFGPTLGIALLIAFVDGMLGLALSGLAVAFDGLPGDTVMAAILDGATALVTTPFVAAATTLVYIDLRVRTEGLDIQLGIARAMS